VRDGTTLTVGKTLRELRVQVIIEAVGRFIAAHKSKVLVFDLGQSTLPDYVDWIISAFSPSECAFLRQGRFRRGQFRHL
jgi:hypothetical protein